MLWSLQTLREVGTDLTGGLSLLYEQLVARFALVVPVILLWPRHGDRETGTCLVTGVLYRPPCHAALLSTLGSVLEVAVPRFALSAHHVSFSDIHPSSDVHTNGEHDMTTLSEARDSSQPFLLSPLLR